MVEPTFDIEHGIVVFFVVRVEPMAVRMTIWFKVDETKVDFGWFEIREEEYRCQSVYMVQMMSTVIT